MLISSQFLFFKVKSLNKNCIYNRTPHPDYKDLKERVLKISKQKNKIKIISVNNDRLWLQYIINIIMIIPKIIMKMIMVIIIIIIITLNFLTNCITNIINIFVMWMNDECRASNNISNYSIIFFVFYISVGKCMFFIWIAIFLRGL